MLSLEGIKVVDLSRAMAGPYCSMLLGDLGAEVIKVEPPGGDDSRGWPPYWQTESAYFLSVNRNKRSITVNLKTEDGREVLRRLVRNADVLLENFSVGVMERFGLGYETLHGLNERLVYCGISGFGRTGPSKQKLAMDIFMQAFCGLMDMTGEEGSSPVRIGISVTDLTAGSLATVGILAALMARHTTGKGQLVDISLLEGQLSWLSYHITGYLATGETPKRLGSGHPSIVPYQAFPTNDGYIVLGTFSDRLFARAAKAMNLEWMLTDPRYNTNEERVKHRAEVVTILNDVLATRSVDEWLALMDQHDVPCAPVNTLDRLLADPQVIHRKGVLPMDHLTVSNLRVPGLPFQMSDTPLEARLAPPVLGQHTDAILTEVGYDAAQRQALRDNGDI